jgi:hypothetical protein
MFKIIRMDIFATVPGKPSRTVGTVGCSPKLPDFWRGEGRKEPVLAVLAHG